MTQAIRKALVAAQCFVQNELECREASFLPSFDSADDGIIREARHTLSVIDKALDSMPKPLPRKRAKPRRVSVNRDVKYRRWLKTEPCVLAWPPETRVFHPVDDALFQRPNDACHTVNNGQSSKGPDSSCVPMCRYHHIEYDSGRAAFEKKYGVDMRKLSAEHYERFLKETEK